MALSLSDMSVMYIATRLHKYSTLSDCLYLTANPGLINHHLSEDKVSDRIDRRVNASAVDVCIP
mgnify:CR=1 FL=1